MKFSKTGFEAFLKGLSGNKLVGNPADGEHCPLCQYLRQQDDVGFVDMSITRRRVNGKSVVNPAWAVNFQNTAMARQRDNDKSQMTAKAALDVLGVI